MRTGNRDVDYFAAVRKCEGSGFEECIRYDRSAGTGEGLPAWTEVVTRPQLPKRPAVSVMPNAPDAEPTGSTDSARSFYISPNFFLVSLTQSGLWLLGRD